MKTFMVVGAMWCRGTLKLQRVPRKVKVNDRYYVEKVLRPLPEVELPNLYPGELHKVNVHHDLASSYSARLTQAYAADLYSKLGIKLLTNAEIPLKSPDTLLLDF